MNINTDNRVSIEPEQIADDKDVMAISKRLIEQNRQAYEVLAQ